MSKPIVLVVDDDPDIRFIAALSLRRHASCEVQEAADAMAAEAMLATTMPDLILLDLMMPEVSGEEFFERLRDSHPELTSRVVFLTADARGQTVDRLRQYGCAGVLKKPFTPTELASQIQAFLANR